jgi:hypothetical protein
LVHPINQLNQIKISIPQEKFKRDLEKIQDHSVEFQNQLSLEENLHPSKDLQ